VWNRGDADLHSDAYTCSNSHPDAYYGAHRYAYVRTHGNRGSPSYQDAHSLADAIAITNAHDYAHGDAHRVAHAYADPNEGATAIPR
jgi:hypothetical protein